MNGIPEGIVPNGTVPRDSIDLDLLWRAVQDALEEGRLSRGQQAANLLADEEGAAYFVFLKDDRKLQAYVLRAYDGSRYWLQIEDIGGA